VHLDCLGLGRAGAVFTEGWDRLPLLTGTGAKTVKRRINAKEIVPPASASAEVLLTMSRVDAAPVAA
jgi:NADH dehydrogenase